MMRPIDVWRAGLEWVLTGKPLPPPMDNDEAIQLRAVRNFCGVYGLREDAVRAMEANVKACVARP